MSRKHTDWSPNRTYVKENAETIYTESESEEFSEECNQTYSSTWTQDSYVTNRFPSYRHESFDSSNSSSQRDASLKETKPKRSNTTPWIYAVILVPILLLLFYKTQSYTKQTSAKNCSYHELQKKFPNEEATVWRDLSIGLENILNQNVDKPGVYLFMHHDREYVRNFVKTIAGKSSKCFGDMTPVELKEEDFSNTNDYGHIIESYRNHVKKSQVILIANLNEIPAEAALALHNICDTHTPIAKNVVIYLTLVPSSSHGNANLIAQKTLTTLWGSKLEQNQLSGLITRITDAVIPLQG